MTAASPPRVPRRLSRSYTTTRSWFRHWPWRPDLGASLVVFLVALPLSLGIAVASNAPVEAGIIAAVIGGIVVGVLGGAPLQVSGPAAGLTAVVAELVFLYGWRVTCFITLASGVVQILLGLSRLARAAMAISPAVIHGMLAGIGVTIVLSQLHVLLGGDPFTSARENLLELPGQLTAHIPAAAIVGLGTVALTVLWPILPRPLNLVPPPLAAVTVMTLVSLPMALPRVSLPTELLSSLALPELPAGRWGGILLAILTVALVASVESLLSAMAVDRMHEGPPGDLNRELVGQGAANTLCGLAGGLPVTGVVVRSTTNVLAGARTRGSTIMHSIWIAVFALALAPVVRQIPLAALAGLLVVIGIRLAVSWARMRTLARHGELLVYLVTLLGVVLLNLLQGILLGIAAALLFALHRALHAPVQVVAPENPTAPWRVVAAGTLTFLSLPRLARQLATIPAGSRVRLELLVDYLDHAAYEMLDNWIRSHERSGGDVFIDEVSSSVFSSIRAGRPPRGRASQTPVPRWLAPWSSWQSACHPEGVDQLLTGVDEFHRRTAPLILDVLGELKHGQEPSTLFLTCSDSRVVPNIITSSGPGDLFTVRNLGPLVPGPHAVGDSTLAAVEYALDVLRVRTIVVCGHSGCGAMTALLANAHDRPTMPSVEGWLLHGLPSVQRARSVQCERNPVDQLGRLNVVQQLENLRRLPAVQRAEAEGRVRLVGMMFDIGNGTALILDEATGQFAPAGEDRLAPAGQDESVP
ncbi:SulP family inorganic anion transporter [Micromonospora sp. NPDC003197]